MEAGQVARSWATAVLRNGGRRAHRNVPEWMVTMAATRGRCCGKWGRATIRHCGSLAERARLHKAGHPLSGVHDATSGTLLTHERFQHRHLERATSLGCLT